MASMAAFDFSSDHWFLRVRPFFYFDHW